VSNVSRIAARKTHHSRTVKNLTCSYSLSFLSFYPARRITIRNTCDFVDTLAFDTVFNTVSLFQLCDLIIK